MSVLLWALAGFPAWADEDHDDIKRLRDSGEILPLQAIVEKLPACQRGGRILDAELEHEYGRYVYEITVLCNDGKVRELVYDARTGALLKVERQHEKEGQH